MPALLKPQAACRRLRPAVLGHVRAVEALCRIGVAGKHPVIVAVDLIGLDRQEAAFSQQNILGIRRLQRRAQVVDKIAQPVLGLNRVRLVLPQRRDDLLCRAGCAAAVERL